MGTETRGLIAFIAGGLAVLSYVLAPKLWSIEGLSAVGTVAAAALALWIALRDGAERRRAAQTAASLEAASMHVKLGPLVNKLRIATARYRFYKNPEEFPMSIGAEWTLKHCLEALKTAVSPPIVISFEHDALVRLTPLPGGTAQKIAQASSIMQGLAVELDGMIDSEFWRLIDEALQSSLSVRYFANANTAFELLINAQEECRKHGT